MASVQVDALADLEHFSLDGVEYEAFNTSGGLGSLCRRWPEGAQPGLQVGALPRPPAAHEIPAGRSRPAP
jgi:hypothetical protein